MLTRTTFLAGSTAMFGLLALTFLVAIITDADSSDADSPTEYFGLFIGVVNVIISGSGLLKERQRSGQPSTSPLLILPPGYRTSSKVRLVQPKPSVAGGVFGGLIGGAVAGLIFAALYTVDSQGGVGTQGVTRVQALLIVVYASAAGTVLGGVSRVVSLSFGYLATQRRIVALILNEVTAGLFAGALAGAIVGALGGWWFARYPTDVPHLLLLGGSSAVGGIIIVLGTLVYDFQGRGSDLLWASLISLGVTIATLALISVVAAFIGVNIFTSDVPGWEDIRKLLHSDVKWRNAAAGAVAGLAAGIVLGLQLGSTIWFYRLRLSGS